METISISDCDNTTTQQQQQLKQEEEEEKEEQGEQTPLNDTTSDFVEINKNKLSESSIQNDESVKHNLDEDDLQKNTNQSITQSTLVITKSQIIEDDLNKSCVDLGDDLNESKNNYDDDDDDEVRDSIEVIQEKRPDNDIVFEEEEEDNNKHNRTLDEFVQPTQEEVNSNKFNNTNTSLDEENLEKDYEIPSLIKSEQFVNLDSGDLVASSSAAANDKRVRNLADEVYEQPLGSESLMKKIVQYGEDDSRPRTGQMCTISYKAFIKETNELVEQDENLSLILGDGDVIAAIDIIVSLMDKNEICEVITEARHAYGKLGKKLPAKTATNTSNNLFVEIPADATLFLRIHLKDYTNVTEMIQMQPVERLSLAEAKKLRGNYYFNRQEFYAADLSYRKGLSYFNEENLSGEEEVADIEKFLDLRKALLMNLSLSTFKQGEYRKALETLDNLLDAQKNHVKALFVKGKCLMNLGETKEAVECLSKCYELDKNNQDVKNELTKAQAKYKTQYENEKKMYQKMMSGVSPDSKTTKTDSNKKSKKSPKTNKNDTNSYKSFVIAGLAVAAVSIGVTMFAKYKNMI